MVTKLRFKKVQHGDHGPTWLGTMLKGMVVGIGSSLLLVSVAWGDLPSPESHEQGGARSTPGTAMQVASFLGTLPYGAAKMGLALFGGLAGAGGYALSGDWEGASEMWKMTMQGTYVLSPGHLTGEKPIRFFIEQDETRSQQ